jgi:Bax inhibitor 1
MNYFSSN